MSEKWHDSNFNIGIAEIQEDYIEEVVTYTLCDYISDLGLVYEVPMQLPDEERLSIHAEQISRLETQLQNANPKTREITLKNGVTMHIIDE